MPKIVSLEIQESTPPPHPPPIGFPGFSLGINFRLLKHANRERGVWCFTFLPVSYVMHRHASVDTLCVHIHALAHMPTHMCAPDGTCPRSHATNACELSYIHTSTHPWKGSPASPQSSEGGRWPARSHPATSAARGGRPADRQGQASRHPRASVGRPMASMACSGGTSYSVVLVDAVEHGMTAAS